MKLRLILTIGLAALGLAFIFDVSPRKASSQALCTEVASVLQEAVESELISPYDAEQITQRCFDRGGLE